MRNSAGFTGERRAVNRRRGGRLGNSAMFFNGFPRISEFDLDFSILDFQVRASFLEEFEFFCGVSA